MGMPTRKNKGNVRKVSPLSPSLLLFNLHIAENARDRERLYSNAFKTTSYGAACSAIHITKRIKPRYRIVPSSFKCITAKLRQPLFIRTRYKIFAILWAGQSYAPWVLNILFTSVFFYNRYRASRKEKDRKMLVNVNQLYL